ncbi:MAG TPA: hypothetical protein VEO53_03140, partial [Candidatus Binatia bacterium]|nr:hypothetical protein [Candidatus Binatia bacterium]
SQFSIGLLPVKGLFVQFLESVGSTSANNLDWKAPENLTRSAAVSSSTNRSTLQAPDAFELPTRCGWSSTQPRSVRSF